MNDIPLSFPAVTINLVRRLWVKEKAWLFGGLLLIALYLFAPQQGATSARFVMGNLLNVAPFSSYLSALRPMSEPAMRMVWSRVLLRERRE